MPTFKFEIGDVVYHKSVDRNEDGFPDKGVVNSKIVEYFENGYRILYSVSVGGNPDGQFFESELAEDPPEFNHRSFSDFLAVERALNPPSLEK